MISIIVGNYKRSYLLPLVIQAYNRYKFVGEEVEMIIVDDNSPEDFIKYLELALKDLEPYFSVKAFQTNDILNTWTNPGISLNIGVKQSKGDIIILNLSDVIPLNPQVLEIISKYHKTTSLFTHLSTTQINADFRFIRYGGQMPVFGGNYGEHSVAGSSMPRSLFDIMGGFDERFRKYGHEDADLLWRMKYGAKQLSIQCEHHCDLFSLHLTPAHHIEPVECPKDNEEFLHENVLGHNWIVNKDGWGDWDDIEEVLTYKNGVIE